MNYLRIVVIGFLLTKSSAKCLNSLISKIYYATYLLLTSVNFIPVVCLISVKLERGDVKIDTLLFYFYLIT